MKRIEEVLKKLILILLVLALLPALVAGFLQSADPLALLLALLLLGAGSYAWLRKRSVRPPNRRGATNVERTPILPGEREP